MSQLDFFVFSTQLFWFLFSFSLGYFFLVSFFLPKLFYIVRFRSWLLLKIREDAFCTIQEVFVSRFSFSKFLVFSNRTLLVRLRQVNRKIFDLKKNL